MQRRGWYVDDDDDRDDVDVTAAVDDVDEVVIGIIGGGREREDDVTTCDSPHVLDAVPPSSMASLGAHPSLASRELRLLPAPPQSPRPLPQRGRAGERGQRRRRLNAVVSDAAHPYPPSAPPGFNRACAGHMGHRRTLTIAANPLEGLFAVARRRHETARNACRKNRCGGATPASITVATTRA